MRLNFSHSDKKTHIKRCKLARDISSQMKYHVGIMGDLQGPKIRIGKFKESSVMLENGKKFIIDSSHDIEAGDKDIVGTDYVELVKDITSKDSLLLDDGRIELKVKSIKGSQIVTEVVNGGLLYDCKAVSYTHLTLPTIYSV